MDHCAPGILMVEDDVNDQIFIRRAFKLSGAGQQVTIVNDGEEATDYLSGANGYADRSKYPLPGLIITDLKMPRMGGIDFLKWIYAQREFRFTPVVVLTSSSNQTDVANAFEHGAKGYMIKPVQFGELEKVIRTIVDYWRASCLPKINCSVAAG